MSVDSIRHGAGDYSDRLTCPVCRETAVFSDGSDTDDRLPRSKDEYRGWNPQTGACPEHNGCASLETVVEFLRRINEPVRGGK